jgi:hypothetical protein
MRLAPQTRQEAIAIVFRAEQRFRLRVAHRLGEGARRELAEALRRYASDVIAIDHAKGVAFAELAETIDTAYARTSA